MNASRSCLERTGRISTAPGKRRTLTGAAPVISAGELRQRGGTAAALEDHPVRGRAGAAGRRVTHARRQVVQAVAVAGRADPQGAPAPAHQVAVDPERDPCDLAPGHADREGAADAA